VDILRPGDLGETLAALAEHPHATLLAGGTDLMVGINLDHLRPEAVVALRRVPELAAWENGFIGAMVTYQRMEAGPLPALAELARTVGSPQIRAAGTLGGNLGTASPAGDTLPFLAALDADIVLASQAGRRRLRWDEFLVGPKQTALRDGELVVGAELPAAVPERQAFAKVGVRQAMVIATVSCCVVREEDGATRVALGAVGPIVLRAREAEAMISEERHPSQAALEEFQRLVGQEARPITDHRSTADYRRHAVAVLARRTLERCL
jgi:CO/xanthine dehydrogenase FAD-binding subunit